MYPQGYFPFPDGVLEPIPKQFLTIDVLGLARSIAADGGFDRLNMLADALMEAGYENEYILLHLQQEKQNVFVFVPCFFCFTSSRRNARGCVRVLGATAGPT